MKCPIDMQIGYIHSTPYGDVEVIQYNSTSNVKIKFILTGYTSTVRANNLRLGKVKDNLKPSVCGIGFFGEGSFKSRENSQKTSAYIAWKNMLNRCYSPNYHAYNYYGGRGVTVCSEWHNFQNFAKWYSLHSFNNCQVDKDISIKDNLIYSPATCICVIPQENIEKAKAKHYEFIDPKGDKMNVYNLTKFCKKHGLTANCMSNVALGKSNNHRGWTKA